LNYVKLAAAAICLQLALNTGQSQPSLSEDQMADRFDEAQRAFHSGQLDRATALYRDLLRLQPGLLEARMNLGLVYFTAGDYVNASTEMAHLLHQQPSLAPANAILGMSYLKLGSPLKAAVPLRRAVRLAPADRDAVLALAACEQALQNYREAAKQLRAVSMLEPNSELALFRLGHGYLGLSKQITEELTASRRAIPWIHRLKGDLAAARCLWNEAAEEYGSASAIEPSQSGLHDVLDYARSKQSDASNASCDSTTPIARAIGQSCSSGKQQDCATRVRSKGTPTASGHVALGKVLLRMGKDEAASEEFADALSLKKDDAESMYWLVRTYARLTEAAFAQLLAAFPDSARTHQLRAETFAVREAYSEAIEEYRAAIRLQPREIELYEELGNLYLLTRALPEARELLEAAAEGSPNARILHLLGRVYLELEQPDIAIPYLEKASNGSPELLEVHGDLGRAYFRTGKVQLAARELKQAAPIDRSGDLHYLLYQSCVALGETRLAAAALTQSRALRERTFATDRSKLTGTATRFPISK
jgi:tetratricopeptide (TPR) repeat protein